ncbi:phosphatase PAP2 family protein [Pseudomonas sp. RIT-PI-a]|uniref:phosphatase PAP2 family protein n=1 Tax=Pseudomonas sp. RIT-PI-a TaxID=1681194 RepID=UPI00067621E3|nr:phosphatase PAP2 family protein [Pseudomonas sp. RIT-PI-a]KNC16637.1 phosphoesterase [Pseudomonas sp. RIT-PI-a]
MAIEVPSRASRPFDFRFALGVPLALMAVMLWLYPPALDFALAQVFYVPGSGFIGRQSYWLENILHDRAKQAVIAFAVLALAGFIVSLCSPKWRQWRRPLGYVVLSMALTTAVVMPLKVLTAVHCPWSLKEFGGQETYTPLLSPRAETEKPGLCWPGGHASSGFSLLALFFFWRDRRPRTARIALAVALGLGAIFSLGRMAQGAHFLSHNIWTLLIDWMICVLCYRWILYRPAASRITRSQATMLTGDR